LNPKPRRLPRHGSDPRQIARGNRPDALKSVRAFFVFCRALCRRSVFGRSCRHSESECLKGARSFPRRVPSFLALRFGVPQNFPGRQQSSLALERAANLLEPRANLCHTNTDSAAHGNGQTISATIQRITESVSTAGLVPPAPSFTWPARTALCSRCPAPTRPGRKSEGVSKFRIRIVDNQGDSRFSDFHSKSRFSWFGINPSRRCGLGYSRNRACARSRVTVSASRQSMAVKRRLLRNRSLSPN